MPAVGSAVLKVIKQPHAVLLPRWIPLCNLVADDDLILGCLCVVLRTLLHLQNCTCQKDLLAKSAAVGRVLGSQERRTSRI